jgi:hypothetical protein
VKRPAVLSSSKFSFASTTEVGIVNAIGTRVCSTLLFAALFSFIISCTKAPVPGTEPPQPSASTVVVAEIPKAESTPVAPGELTNLTAGEMPPLADWAGVYYSPIFGYLHLVRVKTIVKGRWLRPRKDYWGELSGDVQGNLLRFVWKEHAIGAVGPKATKSGRGYFVYSRLPGRPVNDTLEGQVGSGKDEVGTEWGAVKQLNVNPSPDSIGPAADISGGDWDS